MKYAFSMYLITINPVFWFFHGCEEEVVGAEGEKGDENSETRMTKKPQNRNRGVRRGD